MSDETIKAEKCHWQTGRARGGEWREFCTGLRLRGAGSDGNDILVDAGPEGLRLVEVTNPDDYHFVETPVVEVEVPKSLQWGISRLLEAREAFDNEYGDLLTEMMATPLHPTSKA